MTEDLSTAPHPDLLLAHILAKLKETDTGAPDWIMTKADALGAERRARETRKIRRGFLRKDFWLAVLQGMSMALDPLPRPARIKLRNDAPIEADWRKVGDDLRAAMNGLCRRTPLRPEPAIRSRAEGIAAWRSFYRGAAVSLIV
jgi:hypothetical protein